jgi:hypothetical protein
MNIFNTFYKVSVLFEYGVYSNTRRGVATPPGGIAISLLGKRFVNTLAISFLGKKVVNTLRKKGCK